MFYVSVLSYACITVRIILCVLLCVLIVLCAYRSVRECVLCAYCSVQVSFCAHIDLCAYCSVCVTRCRGSWENTSFVAPPLVPLFSIYIESTTPRLSHSFTQLTTELHLLGLSFSPVNGNFVGPSLWSLENTFYLFYFLSVKQNSKPLAWTLHTFLKRCTCKFCGTLNKLGFVWELKHSSTSYNSSFLLFHLLVQPHVSLPCLSVWQLDMGNKVEFYFPN